MRWQHGLVLGLHFEKAIEKTRNIVSRMFKATEKSNVSITLRASNN